MVSLTVGASTPGQTQPSAQKLHPDVLSIIFSQEQIQEACQRLGRQAFPFSMHSSSGPSDSYDLQPKKCK